MALSNRDMANQDNLSAMVEPFDIVELILPASKIPDNATESDSSKLHLAGEFHRNGEMITIYTKGGNTVTIFTGERLTQRELSLDEFVRWASNALEDGSE